MNQVHGISSYVPDRIYLPAGRDYNSESLDDGVPAEQEIENYVQREFPFPCENTRTANYSIPIVFVPQGKAQAAKAEQDTYSCLRDVTCPPSPRPAPLWQVFFQGACYAGRSYRNERAGKLMMREHDFVVFNIYQGKYYISLIEVKSTCDHANSGLVVSNPTSIKNNKRSGLHQLRDHVEILEESCGIPKDSLHCYLFWPFLTMWTKDPTGQRIQRWKEEGDKHVFTDTISDQTAFNDWFYVNVLDGKPIEKVHFDALFKRFIVMSCGIFVNEIHSGMLALLSQEQVNLLYRKPSNIGAPTIVHGAAGTGKTLLVVHKLQHLFECGLLNENNRALYICYWPGIRADFHRKLEKLNLSRYVDSIRFFISQEGFLQKDDRKYRHIFMDECEAICLAFAENIITETFENIKKCRLIDHDAQYEANQLNATNYNSIGEGGYGYFIVNNVIVRRKIPPRSENLYGEMWFLVDINQAALFLPKYSPIILKNPQIVLSKVIRNTGRIFKVFSQFYKNPIPAASQLADLYLNTMDIGHKINGPPIFWLNSDNVEIPPDSGNHSGTFYGSIKVIVDLCSTKGIKPNDLCVLPFLVTTSFLPENVNDAISKYYVADGYRPMSTANVEEFLADCDPNIFLVPWVLRVKGLEFKVVVIAIEQGDFESWDPEDRRKIYIMASRCTCLLVLVSPENVKKQIDMYDLIQNYRFGIEL